VLLPRRIPAVAAILYFSLTLPALHAQTSKPSFANPAISPDGTELAFASGGDIWTSPIAGGQAHLLISDPAEESRPLYSPDGSRLAFQSTRTGSNDIYVLTFATGTLQRITYTDASVALDAWSRDGQWLYFTSTANDVANQGDIFRVRSTGGTPLEVSSERYLNEFESTPTPDGKSVFLVAKGISSSQWWRKGHAHIDETEIWLKPIDSPTYTLVIPSDAKHAWPMLSPDGKSLYLMSDFSGAENIWVRDLTTGTPRQITHFTDGRCLWPTLSYNGKTIVFERNFSIWKLDLATGNAAELSIALRGAPSSPGIVHTAINSWSGLALSPDGQKIAVAAHGDIFAASSKEGGEPQRLTTTEAAESDPQWSPDSTKVVYLSERGGGSSLYLYDFNTRNETALTSGTAIDVSPTFSPDGKMLAFLRDRKELHVLTFPEKPKELNGKEKKAEGAPPNKPTDKIIATGEIDSYGASQIAWSPDSHWLVFVPTGTNGFTNLFAVPADGSAKAQPLTFLANGENASHLAWSPDGKYILFDTSQRSETPQIARVDLVPHVPTFREDQFRDLFRKQSTPGAPDTPTDRTRPHTEETPMPGDTPSDPTTNLSSRPESAHSADGAEKPAGKPAKKPEPTRIVFEGIRDRLTFLPIELQLRFPVISPDGKTLAFVAEDSGQQNIYTYSLDELSREPATPRQLTSTAGSKSDIAFSPTSKELFYLEGGSRGAGGEGAGVRSISLETRTPKPLALSTSIDVDFDQEKMVVFNEAWTTLDHRFWNGDFNGANWPALRDQWKPYIAGARTGPELRRDINLLIGELNSSHSGISKPSQPGVRTGRLGLRFERAPFEANGSLVIREIVPLGPAALAVFDDNPLGHIQLGDKLLAVDGKPITPATNLDALLEDRAGKRTVLTIESGSKKSDAIVRPVPLQVESGLLYRAWVDSRRAYVEKISGGKLGYVHIAAMGDADLSQLYLDLDVQNQSKQGVVIDVRNNNGGYVNGRVIDVFARRNYLLMTPRDGATEPSRQALGQRALGLPTVLVTNESTLSDGEDFTEGYRTLHLGKVVGTPTAGWIIFTGSQRLLDGSQVRVPGDRIRTLEDKDMELHPRPVDVEQLRPLGEAETGEDAQLKKAVETLLSQVK
jgi:tricorn protease